MHQNKSTHRKVIPRVVVVAAMRSRYQEYEFLFPPLGLCILRRHAVASCVCHKKRLIEKPRYLRRGANNYIPVHNYVCAPPPFRRHCNNENMKAPTNNRPVLPGQTLGCSILSSWRMDGWLGRKGNFIWGIILWI